MLNLKIDDLPETKKKLRYYLIHGIEKHRADIMINEFKKWNFDLNNITWINHPNRDELTDELIDKIIIKEDSYSSGVFIPASRTRNALGLVSCTYKHFLALKDIVENNYEYGVIIEDNICFKGEIPKLIDIYIKQLDELYKGEWDILFDGSWTTYKEGPVNKDILIYPKTNEITNQCHGGTKAATFYLIKNSCAKKLIEIYLPFNNSPDWWMNELFRKLNIRSFWVEPSFVYVHPNHKSTTAV
jgi:GR25 family glycosyltransferase involved in LPS biosynthesis